ncbi:periplasmic serine protease DegS [Psychromonas sp. CNPT3]|uniref:outer membrane-stress sensor serine endopeptidase DegS n=1 Tax=Psychromonas sp. CNPT3 TaxID=314282 RepID=UPI0002C0FE2D|nr:outer membrane-stress sensor serine endopeptidase DegS [Psychromonas sp. CNPT3]AGH81884.1 periplasmic serine protease DegS [Psychromonas sp. CNPT3]
MQFKTYFFYFLKPVFWGLLFAVVLLQGVKYKQSISDFLNNDQVMSYHDAVKKASPAVVNIYSQQYTNSTIDTAKHLKPTGLGSGIIVSSNGYIVTNYHVIAQADQILIALQDGRLFTANIIGSDPLTDLAVLQIDGKNLPIIPQNTKYNPQVGDIVLAIGNPYNLGQTITQGIISATGRNGMSSSGRQDFLQTDAAINAGNSGGALINSRGELVGINTSEFYSNKHNVSNGISFAIPYKLANRILHSLIKYGRVIRGSLGIQGKKLDPILARLWGLKAQDNLIVEFLAEGGPADTAGVQKGDILLKINGEKANDFVSTLDKVAEFKPGTEITLTLLRKGDEIKLNVIVGEFDYQR